MIDLLGKRRGLSDRRRGVSGQGVSAQGLSRQGRGPARWVACVAAVVFQTPVGDHVVQWKNKNHKSTEYRTPDCQPSPMPYAVFFADGGVAFHEGTLTRRSAGCVRLEMDDAQRFCTYLQLGDKVQIHR